MNNPFQTNNTKELQQNNIQPVKSVGVPKELENLELASAMDYLKRVSIKFRNEPFKYQEFLSVLRSYKENEIGLLSMVLRIMEIFSNQHSLLSGFKQFLPVSLQLCIEMMQKVKNETTTQIKNQISKVLLGYYQGTLRLTQLEEQIKKLLENYPTLLELFDKFLPKYQTQSFNQQTVDTSQSLTNRHKSDFLENTNSNLEKGEKQKNFRLSTQFEKTLKNSKNPLFLNQYLSGINSQEITRNNQQFAQENVNKLNEKEKEKEILSNENKNEKFIFQCKKEKANNQNLKTQIRSVLYFLLVLLPDDIFLTIIQLIILFTQQKLTLCELFLLLHDHFERCKLLAIEKYFKSLIQGSYDTNKNQFHEDLLFVQNSFLQNNIITEGPNYTDGQLSKYTQANMNFKNDLISQNLKFRRNTIEKKISIFPNSFPNQNTFSNKNQNQTNNRATSRKRYFNENYNREVSEIERIIKNLETTHNYLIDLLIGLVEKMKKEKEKKADTSNLFNLPFLVQTLYLIYGKKTDQIFQNLEKNPIKACMVITKRIEIKLEQLFQ
ncbi:sin3b-related [Anaeramoeba flamelloides]|uniref:Sin3b-related n=1 Tax=Anaeramoeba flamelloides TaxID=1746091 RepID=A0AAV8AGL1_9EUKA|nr:sin3b-related [Anaeramoeba flamelloides]